MSCSNHLPDHGTTTKEIHMTDLNIPAGTYAIDPSHTEVSFVARHAMVTKSAATSATWRAPSPSPRTWAPPARRPR